MDLRASTGRGPRAGACGDLAKGPHRTGSVGHSERLDCLLHAGMRPACPCYRAPSGGPNRLEGGTRCGVGRSELPRGAGEGGWRPGPEWALGVQRRVWTLGRLWRQSQWAGDGQDEDE